MKFIAIALLLCVSSSSFSQERMSPPPSKTPERSISKEIKLILRSSASNELSSQRRDPENVGSPYGGILPGIQITLNNSNGENFSCTTNRNGACSVAGVPSGSYSIELSQGARSNGRVIGILASDDGSEVTIVASKGRNQSHRNIQFAFRLSF